MLRKLKLYGELATFVGHKEFEIQVHSLPQAISFLVNNFPEVEKYMNPKHYLVKVGNYEITENEIHDPIGQQDIHIIPVISGAGGDTFNTILLGAALIGASFFFPGAGLFGTFGSGGVAAAGTTLTAAQAAAGFTVGGTIGTGVPALAVFCVPAKLKDICGLSSNEVS